MTQVHNDVRSSLSTELWIIPSHIFHFLEWDAGVSLPLDLPCLRTQPETRLELSMANVN